MCVNSVQNYSTKVFTRHNTPQESNITKVGNNPLQTAKCHFPRLLSHTMENRNHAGLVCWLLCECLRQLTAE